MIGCQHFDDQSAESTNKNKLQIDRIISQNPDFAKPKKFVKVKLSKKKIDVNTFTSKNQDFFPGKKNGSNSKQTSADVRHRLRETCVSL